MAKIIRNIPYPNFDNLYTSQQSIKDFIKNIHQMFIDAGLQRSADSGQLDPNNIADFDLTYFHAAGQTNVDYPSNNGGNSRTYIQTLPLVYMFTDALQATKPMYIQLTFRLARPERYNASKTKYSYFLQMFINIGSATNGSGQITNSVYTQSTASIGFSTMPVIYNVDGNATMWEFRKTNVAQNSFIYYNSTKGIFYANLFPNFKYTQVNSVTGATNSSGYSQWNKFNPYLNLCIIRNNIHCYVDQMVCTSSISDSATFAQSYPVIQHYFYDNTFYSDGGSTNLYESWKTFSLAPTALQNGYLTLSQVNILDNNKTPNTSPYMLIANINGLPNMQAEIDVKIDATTTKKYIVRAASEYHMTSAANVPSGNYGPPLSLSQLIYVDD